MSLRTTGLLALLWASCLSAVSQAASTNLLSIKGIQIDRDHHLTQVEIKTWGVDVLAVCHIPPVSVVSVDRDIDPGTVLTWRANSWHGELDDMGLKQLSGLFLVRISEFQKESRGDPNGEYHPATFAGSATISAIVEPTRRKTVTLRADNFEMTLAIRCP